MHRKEFEGLRRFTAVLRRLNAFAALINVEKRDNVIYEIVAIDKSKYTVQCQSQSHQEAHNASIPKKSNVQYCGGLTRQRAQGQYQQYCER